MSDHSAVRKLTLIRTVESEYTDTAYIRAVHEADDVVFTSLVRTYLESLTRYAFSFLAEEDAAHDIVQDVFTRVWQLGADWNPQGSIRAYLIASVRNRSFDYLRSEKANSRVKDAVRLDISATDNFGHEPDPILTDYIKTQVQSLPPRQREALHLRYVQGYTIAYIAQTMGITTKGAEKLLSRTVSSLRDKLIKLKEL